MWHKYIKSKCMILFTYESINEITKIARFALHKPSLFQSEAAPTLFQAPYTLHSPLFRALQSTGALLEDHAGGCVLFEKREQVECFLREGAVPAKEGIG